MGATDEHMNPKSGRKPEAIDKFIADDIIRINVHERCGENNHASHLENRQKKEKFAQNLSLLL